MKRRFYVIGFLALVVFDTVAQLGLKYAADHATPLTFDADWLLRIFSKPWVYGALVGYVGAFFTWMTLLKRAPVGPAFAASHLEIVTVMILSVWLFDEHISPHQIVGALAIIAGILCLAISESANKIE
jgi:drug/metabolite transporter (DMT)-like permease